MKNFSLSVCFFRSFLTLLVAASLAGAITAKADSPIDGFIGNGTSLFKSSNWASGVPGVNVTGTIGVSATGNPIGWNNNTNPTGGSIGDLDFLGAQSVVVGAYSTVTPDTTTNVTITLLSSTLNSIGGTVIANSSGKTVTFENDVDPSSADNSTESATTTLQLNNASNVIQATAGSNIIIDNVITGSGDALTYLGGGNGSTAGAILELGAGSSNDVVGGVAPNAPKPLNGGSNYFTSTATVKSSDQNSFTGGLTIGDTGGTANAGVVQVDAPNGLPTTGTVTVNTNSQLALNGNGTYGGASQQLVLNGPGTSATSGALLTTSGVSATWQGTVNVASASTINSQGSSGSLTISGAISGSSQISKKGAGVLDLTGNNSSFSGGFNVTNGTLEAGNANAFGTGSISLATATLTSSLTNTPVTLGGLAVTTGTVDLLAQSQATFAIASAQNFTMSGGALDLTYSGGNTGSISSAGGGSSFDITGGTLSLGGGSWNYGDTYDILSGFGSGSVSGLTVTNYDTTDYTASVSNSGVLSFEAVPEPGTWGMALAALGTLVTIQQVRRRRRA